MFSNLEQLAESQVFCKLWLQGYTLADEEEDPLIYQHRMLRSGQGDALASGPVETPSRHGDWPRADSGP